MCFILVHTLLYLLSFVNFILAKKVSTKEEKASTESDGEDDDAKKGSNLIQLTKAERRQKLKKEKKEAKKLNKDEDLAPSSPKEKLHSEVLVICFSNLFTVIIIIISYNYFACVLYFVCFVVVFNFL